MPEHDSNYSIGPAPADPTWKILTDTPAEAGPLSVEGVRQAIDEIMALDLNVSTIDEIKSFEAERLAGGTGIPRAAIVPTLASYPMTTQTEPSSRATKVFINTDSGCHDRNNSAPIIGCTI